MSEPIKSQIISRRRIFLLAAMAAFAVPATMLPMSNAGAQQAGDQAPADQTPANNPGCAPVKLFT